jgi:hypothetical protein
MAKLDALRKIIREEVRAVFQEELAGILKEAVMANKSQQPLTEVVKSKPTTPGTLNRQVPKLVPPVLSPNNPLNNLLAETAMSMSPRDFEGLGGGSPTPIDTPVVNSMDGMFAAARKSSNLDAIEINAVPDFTGIMAKMRANGEV